VKLIRCNNLLITFFSYGNVICSRIGFRRSQGKRPISNVVASNETKSNEKFKAGLVFLPGEFLPPSWQLRFMAAAMNIFGGPRSQICLTLCKHSHSIYIRLSVSAHLLNLDGDSEFRVMCAVHELIRQFGTHSRRQLDSRAGMLYLFTLRYTLTTFAFLIPSLWWSRPLRGIDNNIGLEIELILKFLAFLSTHKAPLVSTARYYLKNKYRSVVQCFTEAKSLKIHQE